MAPSREKCVVALLAVPESSGSTLYGMYEMLEAAGRDWYVVAEGKPGESLFHPRVVSATGRPFQTPSGLTVAPHAPLADFARVDIVVIPDLYVPPSEDLCGRYPAECAWLRACHAAGATVATACTGALILADTGLLDGEDVTTHWAYCDALAARYPKVRVHKNRALVTSGLGQRLVMAGGGTSWHDLALFLIARFAGPEEAMRVARVYLIDWHNVGQQPFASLTRHCQAQDATIARCQEWIATHYDAPSPVSAMARLSGLSERSFKRRFLRATGMSPLEYVHSLRLEETKHILETTDLPIEAVANMVGYEDGSFFGRMFRRNVGLTPAQYRKRFRGLRGMLVDGGSASRTTAASASER